MGYLVFKMIYNKILEIIILLSVFKIFYYKDFIYKIFYRNICGVKRSIFNLGRFEELERF